MLIEAYQTDSGDFCWIDLVDPSVDELENLAKTYRLNITSVRDFLTPKHLPKIETIDDYTFVILRGYEERYHNEATIHGLTRKIAFFIGKNFLITLHRNDPSFMSQIRNNWVKNEANLADEPLSRILIRIIQGVFSSYSQAIYDFECKVEKFEDKIFKDESTQNSIRQKFIAKRKTSVIKQVLKMSLDLLPHLKKICNTEKIGPIYQEMTELAESQYFSLSEILENINNLINLQLSLASHQTSNVIRVLTIFSIYFLPTTFIASFYGMNFKYMPELDTKYGYPVVIAAMVIIVIGLYYWFKKRKWIK